MHSYTLTIGRGAGARELPLERWQRFMDATWNVMGRFTLVEDVLEQHNGFGTWEGVREESCKVTLLREVELSSDSIEALRGYVQVLAGSFDQDAIALTIGTSELITPTNWDDMPQNTESGPQQ